MNKEEPVVELERKSPERGPSATEAPLNNTAALLPPGALRERDRALAALTLKREILPDITIS